MTEHSILPFIKKPGRYLGSEYNSTPKNWEEINTTFALIFPDMYEIGMSHQGLQILYHIINQQKSFLAERCYCPDIDVEKLLKEQNKPLCSLENSKPLNSFDVLAITLPYELCYTNILTILDTAGIPFYREQRGKDAPLLLAGGACSMNPEPVADFFDAVLLGDGEDAIIEIGEAVETSKSLGESKHLLLERLEKIDGVYLPAHFSPEYDDEGRVIKIVPTPGKAQKITRRVVPNLDKIDHLLHPIVPNAKIVHDRLGVEVARGCTRGCRFCQAGITYRPVRERTPEQIMKIAETAIEDSGFDELALLSLSTGDYSCLETVLPKLMDEFSSEFVSVAMPSMRVGTLTENVMDQIKRVRKTGFTLAPEAGSERLRRVINKGITEEDLLNTCEHAFALGWKVMKLYFMIGLPTETEEDINEIAVLAGKTRHQGIKTGHGKRQIKVSVGTFVPKPHTPFQWHKQLTIEESRGKIFSIKDQLPKGCNLSYHSPTQGFLEGVFSRGDRRLSRLLEEAWKLGARFDGWSDYFHLERWRMAAKTCGLDLEHYLRARDRDEVLPWQHLETGVDSSFLLDEFDKALKEEYTPDCRYNDCQKCGLCDFDIIAPIVHSELNDTTDEKSTQSTTHFNVPGKDSTDLPHFKYMVHYQRHGNISYLGHLEILQLMFRALKRTKITTNFSQGYNPSPKISFGPALPVGTESLAEYFIMDLPSPLQNPTDSVARLNKNMAPGLIINEIVLHSGKIDQDTINYYTVTLPRDLSQDDIDNIVKFNESEEHIIERLRKGKIKQIDIRPMFLKLEHVSDTELEMQLVNRSSFPGIKPQEAIKHLLGYSEELVLMSKVLKTKWLPYKSK